MESILNTMAHPAFLWGVLLGTVMATALGLLAQTSYRKTLQMCADQGTCERLPDGSFYYLVAERRYGALLGYERVMTANRHHGSASEENSA